MTRKTLAALVLAGAMAPGAQAQFRAGPEMLVDQPTVAAAPGTQEQPAVIWAGSNYFVVWLDRRNPVQLLGARIAADGRNLDPQPLRLVTSTETKLFPKLSWNGQELLLGWTEGTLRGPIIRVTAVLPDGTVRDRGGAVVQDGMNEGLSDLVWDGTRYLAVWDTLLPASPNQVMLRQIAKDGLPMGAPIVVSSSTSVKTDVAIGGADGKMLIVWSQRPSNSVSNADLFGALLADGQVQSTDQALIQTPGSARGARVGWGGAAYLVTYRDGELEIPPRALRVGPDGTVLTPGGFALTPAEGYFGFPVRQALIGQQHLAVWPGNVGGVIGVRGGRLGLTGTVPAAGVAHLTALPKNTNMGALELATDGTRALAVWTQQVLGSDGEDVVAVRTDENGAATDATPIVVAAAGNAQRPLAVGSNGTELLAVWSDDRVAGQSQCRATRIGSDGVALDPDGIPLATGVGFCTEAAVAWNGTQWGVAWFRDISRIPVTTELRFSRVSRDGKVAEAAGREILGFGAQHSLAVDSDGDAFLVVHARVQMGSGWDIVGTRVAADGALKDAMPITISNAPMTQYGPAVSWNGQHYLVAWSDERNGPSSVYGARVDKQGVVMDPNGLPLTSGTNQGMPLLAWNGSNHLLTWRDLVSGKYIQRAARVTPAGMVLDGDGLTLADEGMRLPDQGSRGGLVAWPDGSFGLAWEDVKRLSEPRVAMVRIDAAGKLLDESPIEVVPPSTGPKDPAIAALGARALVLYGLPDQKLEVNRLRARFVGDPPLAVTTDAGAGGETDAASDGGVVDAASPIDVMAAPADLGASADAGTASADSSDCGCALGGRGGDTGGLAWLLLLLALSGRRRPTT
jgi:hypothetical protein